MRKCGRPRGKSKLSKAKGKLGILIRRARLKRGLGLADFGYTPQFISNIEQGRSSLPWKQIRRISRLLNIPLSALVNANMAFRKEFREFRRHFSTVKFCKRRSRAA